MGFPALRKAVTAHVKNIVIFHVCLKLLATLKVDKWTAKPSPFTIQGLLWEFFRIMAPKTLKYPYRLLTMTFNRS